MKKVLSVALSVIMICSLTACSGTKSAAVNKDAVIELAEDFGDAIASAKFKNFKKLCADVDEDELSELFENITESASVKGDTSDAHNAIFSTFEYEIDEDSIVLLKKGATIEVTYSVKNFDKVELANCQNISDFESELDAVKKYRVASIELEIESGEDSLLVSNPTEVLEAIYVWEDYEVDFDSVAITEATEATEETEPVETTETTVKETESVETEPAVLEGVEAYKSFIQDMAFYDIGYVQTEEGYVYESAAYIESEILLYEGYDQLDWEEVTCYVYYNDEFIDAYYVALVDDSYGLAAACGIGIGNHPELGDKERNYLSEGIYTFEYYSPDDEFITSNYCEVVILDQIYTFTIEEGDSPELDNFLFADWYYFGAKELEFDMYNVDFGYQHEFSYKLYKGDEELFSSLDYYGEDEVDDGVFSDVYIQVADCNLDKFEKGEYKLDVVDKDGLLIYSTNFIYE